MNVQSNVVSVRRAARARFVLLAALLAVTAASTAAQVVAPSRAEAQMRARAIVLSFEGWHADDARTAVTNALSTQYELITEEQAINTAAQIAVDVSTPEGMAAVVQHLGIELVVGGSVAGTGRRSSTTIFVLDRNGNEIGNGTAPGPTGRAADFPIGQTALQACDTAMNVLHPPQQQVIQQQQEPEQTYEEPVHHEEEQPPMRSMEEIENETPGMSRGQGGSRQEERHDETPTDGRWNQPVFRGLLGLDLRNRSAYALPADERISGENVPQNLADFYPQWMVELELRPAANNDDALRGLYARVATSFSIGINYYTVLDLDPHPLQTFNIEVDVGYAATLGEVFELIGSVGFGYDSYYLQLANDLHFADFPSTAYPYLPINVGGRVRLLPSSVSGVDLHLEAMVGPRILLGGGQLAGTAGSEDPETALYFAERTGAGCPLTGIRCDGDFGGVSGAAINFYAGIGLMIDPGFSAALRVQYTNYFLGFSEGTGTRGAISGNDESVHIQVLVGWAFH